MNFHENKLWQAAYVALMDLYDAFDGLTEDREIIDQLLASGVGVVAKIADGLSRRDRRLAQTILSDAAGLVSTTRSHLAVAWGKKLLQDDAFRTLDGKYQELSSLLQR
ncbi:hypothetical protein A3A79_01540 [Candidatus Gottesmanbacteria bacterium RIFCSPLOWO2_01_FULL_43_11b]|uniref:Four helix bundle protein n=1 Tax=Candidatus Gottesmanbacteria bacterium RIFCSPLOWO2_01_FULL_43_11b TaxID=1798392 RepID=A0A1F6AHX4_9BACT|nr:MAG: hypothetical protein A3A79_01540 [Candidatus Gottesmanbacteria bacterium RIFCSPLOWO2_01_FULL_43_11b]